MIKQKMSGQEIQGDRRLDAGIVLLRWSKDYKPTFGIDVTSD